MLFAPLRRARQTPRGVCRNLDTDRLTVGHIDLVTWYVRFKLFGTLGFLRSADGVNALD